MLTVTSTLFLALLFIVGLIIITFFSFPTKRTEKAPTIHGKSTITPKEEKNKSSKGSEASRKNHNNLELRNVFATFDKNNDGYITKQELKLSLRNIGFLLEDRDVDDMVEKVDSNGDGLIDLDEFCELYHSFLATDGEMKGEEIANREKDLKDAFDVFDYDKDGLISEEELDKILSSLGLKMKSEQYKEMIRKVDVDGDGMVNFEEFKKLIASGGTFTPTS